MASGRGVNVNPPGSSSEIIQAEQGNDVFLEGAASTWGQPWPFLKNPGGNGGKSAVPEDFQDVNTYQMKKTVAQGMMDIALLSANANQLRYVLEIGQVHPYFYMSLALIGISVTLQFIVGLALIWISRHNVSTREALWKAERINNWIIFSIFTITVANVFITAFGIAFDSPLQLPTIAPEPAAGPVP